METNGLSQDELKSLSDIEGFDTWTSIERFYPETRYVPENSKVKTGVISMPPKKRPPVSHDRKLYLVSTKGKKLLLKTDNISQFEKEAEIATFSNRAFNEGGVYVSYPIEVGAYAGETKVYSIYHFFSGDNLARRLPELHIPQQLELGVEAGKQLKKLHSITAKGAPPEGEEDIFILLTRLEEKNTQYIGFKQASDYMKSHAGITSGRPVCALHGDFSANTLFIDKGLTVGMFPFENPKWGDPISDLTMLQESYSLPFIKGVLKGLFDGAPPSNFFELLAYYSTEHVLSDIDRAHTPDVLANALLRAQKLAADLDSYQSAVPNWY